jgi:microcystin-dependent protein
MACPDGFMGSVELWPLDYAPEGWAICNGQMLIVQQCAALYSLLGVNFGGTVGGTTFGLPDMRGRVPVGMGQQPGGTNYKLGSFGGAEAVLLTGVQGPMAPHTHPATVTDPSFSASVTGTVTPKAKTGPGKLGTSPAGNYMGASTTDLYSTTANGSMAAADMNITVTLAKVSAGSVAVAQNAGIAATQAHENRMPYQVLNYIIALAGLYPSRP